MNNKGNLHCDECNIDVVFEDVVIYCYKCKTVGCCKGCESRFKTTYSGISVEGYYICEGCFEIFCDDCLDTHNDENKSDDDDDDSLLYCKKYLKKSNAPTPTTTEKPESLLNKKRKEEEEDGEEEEIYESEPKKQKDQREQESFSL